MCLYNNQCRCELLWNIKIISLSYLIFPPLLIVFLSFIVLSYVIFGLLFAFPSIVNALISFIMLVSSFSLLIAKNYILVSVQYLLLPAFTTTSSIHFLHSVQSCHSYHKSQYTYLCHLRRTQAPALRSIKDHFH